MKKKKPKKRYIKRSYNVEMIKDFLEHLMWELTIADFENRQKDKSKTNPELVDQLYKYIKKWNTNALMAATIISDDLDIEEKKAITEMLTQKTKTALDALNELKEVLLEAFECAKFCQRNKVLMPARKFTKEGITNGSINPYDRI